MSEFERVLTQLALYIGLSIDLIAVLIVAIGSIEALIGVGRLLFTAQNTQADKREVYLKFAQWLVAGLTFQLAADIVHTAIAPSWDQLGKLAAIAAIRTLLTFFLDRDIEHALQMREKEKQHGAQL